MANSTTLFNQVPAIKQQNGDIVFFSPYNSTVGVVPAHVAANSEVINYYLDRFGCSGTPSNQGPSLPQNFDLTLLVTNSCNLRCKYCFANAGENKNNMALNTATSIVEGVFQKTTRPNVKISFFGGEPTLRMPLIKHAVNHVRKLSRRTGKGHLFYITTNGVLSRESLEYLVNNEFTFVISMDGHPDIQNLLRPMAGGGSSSQAVEETIDYLVSQRVPFKVRSTITNLNVESMEENIRYFGDLGVETVHYEPMTRTGRASREKAVVARPLADLYSQNFIASLNAARECGVSLISSSYMNLLAPSLKFCDAMAGSRLVGTWEGNITLCVEVQDSCHPYSEHSTVGNVIPETHQIKINHEKYSKIIGDVEVQKNRDCMDCFAKFCCGGGCPVKSFYSCGKGSVDPYRCQITKILVKEILLRIQLATIAAGDVEYSSDALTLYSMHVPQEVWMKRKRSNITQYLARAFVGHQDNLMPICKNG